MRVARKLFRLYKWINEYQKFMDLLDSPPKNTDEINLVLSRRTSLTLVLLSRAFLALYWVFDNIQIVTQLKIFNGDQEKWGRRGMLAWWVSLVCNLVQSIRSYMKADSELKYYIKVGRQSPEKKEAFKPQFNEASAAKKEALLNIVKAAADLLTATKGSGRPRSDPRTRRQIRFDFPERLLVWPWRISLRFDLLVSDLQVTKLTIRTVIVVQLCPLT